MATTKQITDNQSKAVAAPADILLLRDVSSNSDKKTTIAGISSAVVTSVPDASIPATKVNMDTTPAAFMHFGSFGSGTGQVINVTPAIVLFDSITNNSGTGITKHANGTMRIATAGFYCLILNLYNINSDSGTGAAGAIRWSSNNVTWTYAVPFGNNQTVDGGRGTAVRVVMQYLPADSYVQAQATSTAAIRFGASSEESKVNSSLQIFRVG